jgi:hypothetical protein
LRQLEVDRLVLDSLILETRDIDPGKYTIDERIEQLRVERENGRRTERVKAEQEAIAKRSAERQKAIDKQTAENAEAERQRVARERAHATRNVPQPPRFSRKPSFVKPPDQ